MIEVLRNVCPFSQKFGHIHCNTSSQKFDNAPTQYHIAAYQTSSVKLRSFQVTDNKEKTIINYHYEARQRGTQSPWGAVHLLGEYLIFAGDATACIVGILTLGEKG